MPRFLLDAQLDLDQRACAAADARQPEVDVDEQWVDHDDERHAYLVCRAPSLEHVRLWAAATRTRINSVRMVHPPRKEHDA